MDDVDCSDSNAFNLRNCNYNPNHNCGSGEGAGVICLDFRLPVVAVGGFNYNEGNLYVKNSNSFSGPVCDDSWGSNDASVVCRYKLQVYLFLFYFTY